MVTAGQAPDDIHRRKSKDANLGAISFDGHSVDSCSTEYGT
ncbi:hypothetical protein PT7_2662 [Pusillimonas sp. T7-7]|nr:hypothetical protein PT7_2662 [Pusillimonas sp. T7-7]